MIFHTIHIMESWKLHVWNKEIMLDIVSPCCSWVEKILTKNLPWEFLIDIFFYSKNRVHDTCHQQRQPLWRSPHSAWSYASAQIQTSEYVVWKNMVLSQTGTTSWDTQHKANFYVFRWTYLSLPCSWLSCYQVVGMECWVDSDISRRHLVESTL